MPFHKIENYLSGVIYSVHEMEGDGESMVPDLFGSGTTFFALPALAIRGSEHAVLEHDLFAHGHA